MEKPMRWFYFSYSAVVKTTKKEITGHLAMWNEGFPSMMLLSEKIIPDQCGQLVDNIVLRNIFEFQSEEDYMDFVEGYSFLDQTKDLLGLN